MRVNQRRVRHNRAAQIVNLDIADGTCELRLSRSLHSQRFTLGIILHFQFSILHTEIDNQNLTKTGSVRISRSGPCCLLDLLQRSNRCLCVCNKQILNCLHRAKALNYGGYLEACLLKLGLPRAVLARLPYRYWRGRLQRSSTDAEQPPYSRLP